MNVELPLHRVIFFPEELGFPRQDPTMDALTSLLFVESAIDYVLRTHLFVFDFPMPVDLKVLQQRLAHRKVFNSVMGKAIAHSCAETSSVEIAKAHGFAEEDWLQFESDDIRKCTTYYLDVIQIETKPANLGLICMLSFAMYLAKGSLIFDKEHLIKDIVWSILHILAKRFPYEWIYRSLHHWALTYNFRHNDIHRNWILEDYTEEGLGCIEPGQSIIGWVY